MRRSTRIRNCLALAAVALAALHAGGADLELTAPDGRRVLLKDDGTWRYAEPDAAAAAAPAASAASAPEPPKPTAELVMLRRVESPSACSFEFELTNTLPYEIRSIVPFIAVARADGVVYNTESIHFGPLKPGDTGRRSLRFGGIECREIAKVEVQGGDRCEMGDLNKFSDAKGECLSRVRVRPSPLVAFAK